MQAVGVGILAATDAGSVLVYPGFSLHEELRLLVEAGLSPMDALAAATANPARFSGRDSLGAIAPGKIADLVLLDADPVADIRNSGRIAAVFQRGRHLDRTTLDSLLSSARSSR